jgi:hypothetical protein
MPSGQAKPQVNDLGLCLDRAGGAERQALSRRSKKDRYC